MSKEKKMKKNFCILYFLLFSLISIVPAHSYTTGDVVNMSANFALNGRYNYGNILGYGDFSFKMALDDSVISEGSFSQAVGGSVTKNGVFEDLPIGTNTGWTYITDYTFNVPFSMVVGDAASLNVTFKGNAIRIAQNFIINNGGLFCTLSLLDGTALEDAGLDFSFIFPNTTLYAAVSNSGPWTYATATPPDEANANVNGYPIAVAKMIEDDSFMLSFLPEANPLIVDYAETNISGLENVIVTNTVPIPGAIWLLGTGVIGIIGIRKK